MPVCTTDAQCDDGTFCNGVARCTPTAPGADARGCVPSTGTSCLPSQTCNEAMRLCETACDSGGDADGDGARAMSCGGDDCDDSDALAFPSNAEVCDTHDEDCNPATLGPDADGDGFPSTACCNGAACGADCNDTSDTVGPSGTESCNLVDDDCDGLTDEGVQATCFVDGDGDGYAAVGAAPMMMCTCGAGFTATAPTTAADCNDALITVNPVVPEVCNLIDDNCNGMVDDGVGATFYRDLDRDGQGAAASGTVRACTMPAMGYAPDNTDCNDGCMTCFRGGTEVCDGNDNDCDTMIDEVVGASCSVGIGACRRSGTLRCDGMCTAVAGAADPAFHTGADPINGSFDWNCDGVVSPEFAPINATFTRAGAYCQAQTCAYIGFSGQISFDTGVAQYGPQVTGLGSTPFCGAGLWSLAASGRQCVATGTVPAPCTGTFSSTSAVVQRCR